MKKIFSMALAAVCALTVAAFGISACDELDDVIDSINSSDSTGDTSTGTTDSTGDASTGTTDSTGDASTGTTDSTGDTSTGDTSDGGSGETTVTMAQWMTIMSVANSLLNVTVDVAYTSETTTTFTDGDVGVDYVNKEGVIKTDLVTGTDITGNIYTYSSTGYSGTWNGEADYSYTMTTTQYEVFASDSYSYVNYNEYTQVDDEPYTYYDGYMLEEALTITDSEVYDILSYIDTLAAVYSMLTYEDGVYTYDGSGIEINVTLNGLYISQIEIIMMSSYTETGYYTDISTEIYTLTFSGYGTTTVEVPEAYTYAYYAANNMAE